MVPLFLSIEKIKVDTRTILPGSGELMTMQLDHDQLHRLLEVLSDSDIQEFRLEGDDLFEARATFPLPPLRLRPWLGGSRSCCSNAGPHEVSRTSTPSCCAGLTLRSGG